MNDKLYTIKNASAETGMSASRIRQLIDGQLVGDVAYPPVLVWREHWKDIDKRRFVTVAGIAAIKAHMKAKQDRLAERKKLAKKMRAKK